MAAEIKFSLSSHNKKEQEDEEMVIINDAAMYNLFMKDFHEEPAIRKQLDEHPIVIFGSKISVHYSVLPLLINFAKKKKLEKKEEDENNIKNLDSPLVLSGDSIEYENEHPRLQIYDYRSLYFENPNPNSNIEFRLLSLFNELAHNCFLLSPSTKKTKTLNVRIISNISPLFHNRREKLKRGHLLKIFINDINEGGNEGVEYFRIEFQKVIEKPRFNNLSFEGDKLKMHVIKTYEYYIERFRLEYGGFNEEGYKDSTYSFSGSNSGPQSSHLTLCAQFILIITGIIYKDDEVPCTQICRLKKLD